MNQDVKVSTRSVGTKEFIALVASMTALVALSIDAMLPALPNISSDLNLVDKNDAQLVIAFIFIGMAIGPVWFGPLSDSIGRKRAIYIGFVLFVFGSLIAWFSESFEWLLAGRIIQGLGVSGPRIVAMAMVRDCFKGNEMARVMSFVTAVFIIVPALAPSVGQLVVSISSWRHIFLLFVIITLSIWGWLSVRQTETLNPDNIRPFNLRMIVESGLTVLSIKKTRYFTVATGLVFGSFMGYLNSSQQLFQDIYRVGDKFPLYFAVLALGFGGSSLLNARLVMRFGMHFLAQRAVQILMVWSYAFLAYSYVFDGVPPFFSFLVFAMLSFMFVAITFGNLNAMAMEPLGHVAGMGAAFISTLSTLIALPIGILVGQAFNQTLLPVLVGFTLCSTLAWIIIIYAGRDPVE